MTPEVKHRANQARELKENEAFNSILNDIRDNAVQLFLNAKSGIDEIAEAHQQVRAVETVLDALQARLNEESVQEKRDAKKDQHRGND